MKGFDFVNMIHQMMLPYERHVFKFGAIDWNAGSFLRFCCFNSEGAARIASYVLISQVSG